jgi:initiation factor 1A
MKRGGKKKKRGRNKFISNRKGFIRLPEDHDIWDEQSKTTIKIHELVGRVLQKLGGGKGSAHVLVKCHDGKQYTVRIPGKWHKRVWINLDDLLLVGYADNMSNTVEALHKYTNQRSISTLKKQSWYSKLFDSIDEVNPGCIFDDDEENDIKDENDENDEINLEDFESDNEESEISDINNMINNINIKDSKNDNKEKISGVDWDDI